MAYVSWVLFTGPAEAARSAAALFDAEATARGWPHRGTADLARMFGASEVVTVAGEPAAIVAALVTRIANPPPPPPPTVKPTKPGAVVKVGRETAGRKGKGVTVVWELPLTDAGMHELAARLKQKCGTGGTVKEGRIEIQGDQRERIISELEALGYKPKRAGG